MVINLVSWPLCVGSTGSPRGGSDMIGLEGEGGARLLAGGLSSIKRAEAMRLHYGLSHEAGDSRRALKR